MKLAKRKSAFKIINIQERRNINPFQNQTDTSQIH